MDKCREEFLKDVAEIVPCWCEKELMHYEYDEKANCFRFEGHGKYSNYTIALNNMWCIYQHQQLKTDMLKGQLIKLGFTDKGGQLMKPPLGEQPRFDLLDELKNSINKLAQKYRAEAHELSLIRDFEKSQMYSHFARELDQLLKGGA